MNGLIVEAASGDRFHFIPLASISGIYQKGNDAFEIWHGSGAGYSHENANLSELTQHSYEEYLILLVEKTMKDKQ